MRFIDDCRELRSNSLPELLWIGFSYAISIWWHDVFVLSIWSKILSNSLSNKRDFSVLANKYCVFFSSFFYIWRKFNIMYFIFSVLCVGFIFYFFSFFFNFFYTLIILFFILHFYL